MKTIYRILSVFFWNLSFWLRERVKDSEHTSTYWSFKERGIE